MNLDDLLAKFEKPKRNGERWLVRCPAHADGTASLQLSEGSGGNLLVKCFAGCDLNAICAALGIKTSDLFAKPLNGTKEKFAPRIEVKPKLVKTYDYHDARGRLVYQACRLEAPDITKLCGYAKSFRQRRPNPKFDGTKPEDRAANPRWLFNMDGVTRVLYRLPQVMAAETVWLVEGEKDADNVNALLAVETTTNVGGAKKWLDAYTDSLEGKDVIICGDNDAPGREHVELVSESIQGKVKSTRFVELPDKFKDVTDFIEARGDKAKDELLALLEKSPVFHKGLRVPVYSMAEMEPMFEAEVEAMETNGVSLGRWLPSLGRLDPLIAGDLVLVIAGTGVGKTALAQNFVLACAPLPTLFFEIELTSEKMFKRFVSIKTGQTKREVVEMYRSKVGIGKDVLNHQFKNLFVCPLSKVTTKEIESIIRQSALKIGEPPKIVIVDYVQLIKAEGKSRYERASNVAEDLKVIAKSCGVIMIALSQIGRPEKTDDKAAARGVGLHDAKDSGSLENSSALAIGAWRDPHDATLITMRVLKSTEGGAGMIVRCDFDGANMRITERVEAPDVED